MGVTRVATVQREEQTARVPERRPKYRTLAAVLSALIPGVGQWYAGRTLRGWLFFAPHVVLLAGTIVGYRRGTLGLLELAVQPDLLRVFVIGDAVALIWRAWAAIDAWMVVVPGWRPSVWSRAALGAIVVVLAAPHVLVGGYAMRGIQLVETVFVTEEEVAATTTTTMTTATTVTTSLPPEATPDPQIALQLMVPDADSARNLIFRQDMGDPDAVAVLADVLAPPSLVEAPFVAFDQRVDPGRISFLLVGGDAGPGRTGLRTDTMMVATIDTATGDAAIFGMPRNFKYIPLPKSMHGVWVEEEQEALRAMWTDDDEDGIPDQWVDLDGDELPDEPEFESCDCYVEMLNSIYGRTRSWDRSYPGTPDPGMAALRDVVSHLLDLRIDYYVLVDMAAFVRGIDAIGGVDVMVQDPLHVTVSAPWEGAPKATVNVEEGMNHLTGFEALAYTRWRWGSSDYARMQRQRCLVRAAAAQADPVTLLTAFPTIASVIEDNVVTDVPASFLPELVRIAGKVNFNDIATVGFVPPTYNDGRALGGYPIPDVDKIRWKVDKVIAEGIAAQTKTGDSECGA